MYVKKEKITQLHKITKLLERSLLLIRNSRDNLYDIILMNVNEYVIMHREDIFFGSFLQEYILQ